MTKEEEIRSYRDLRVWQKGMEIAASVYRLTQNWPKAELYGLTAQARRAATSIPANIAEGYGRHSTGSYVQFLKIAQGSLKELETHLILASRIDITTEAAVEPILLQTDDLGKMLFGLIRKLSTD
jgi:four helix bundle protein